MVCDPGLAVTLPLGQSVNAAEGFATTTPLVVLPGRLSVSETFTRGIGLLFLRVIVRVERPFGLTDGGKKTLLMEKDVTVRFAERSPVVVRF